MVANEAIDVSRTEQLSITIRWVDKAYQVYEDTLCLKELRDTKAIFTMKLKMFFGLPVSQCRARLMMVQVT